MTLKPNELLNVAVTAAEDKKRWISWSWILEEFP